jgi:hypothetical protein
MNKTLKVKTLDLDKRLFWDVEYKAESAKDYPEFIVERVIQRGTGHDLGLIIDYYGYDKVRQSLINNHKFSDTTKNFLKIYFNLTDQDLCSLRPFTQKLWKY